ncbi:MAG: hypothetical protein JWR21_927 [Herminiimonas sp.]|nr:hypothetical protein [Herminiimonas sp.]
MSSALAIVTGTIQEVRESFSNVLADRSLSFEREAGFAIQQLSRNEYTLKIASSNRESVMNAVKNIAAIGISLNPAKKQAYLVPRDSAICLDISYLGLLDLAIASGSIMWGQAELVHDGDGFTLNGFDKPPTHERNPFAKDRGDIIGVYVVVKTRDGDYLTTTMQIDEVNAIRDRSEGWKAYVAKKIKSTPWATDAGEMIKKTVIKRAYKLWPKTDRLDQAIHFLNTEGGEGLGFSAAPAPAVDHVDAAPMIAEALATKSDADALNYWRTNNGRLAKQPADHARLKQAIMEHRARLKASDEARTVDMPAAKATPVSPEMEGMLADLDASADEGPDQFTSAWNSLSETTRSALANHFDRLNTKAQSKGTQ